jgi:signal peptidase I
MLQTRRSSNCVAHPARIFIHGGVFVFLLAGLIQTWLLDGVAIPCRIVGDSMAETLLGTHRNVVCGDCGMAFSCGDAIGPSAAIAPCPNCGYADNRLESLSSIAADCVGIDRVAFSTHPPRRWEVIAFRSPQRAEQICLKRVAGLPNETIEIRDGNVYADGRIQRKNLAEQRALAILVHDADYCPTHEPKPPMRWRPEPLMKSRWNTAGQAFEHPLDSGSERRIDWLVYHHTQRFADGTILESPVSDLCSYNPSQPRRDEDVHGVPDLMLAFRLQPPSGQGAFWIRATNGYERFEVRLQYDSRRYQVFRNGRPIAAVEGDFFAANAETCIEVSLIDQQFLLALDGQTLVALPDERTRSAKLFPEKSVSCPFAIGVQGVGAVVQNVRVYRDVYYTHPIGLQGNRLGTQPTHLAADEYYVLGDNSPVSEDSRTWPEPCVVSSNLLVGKPLTAISSILISPGGDWHFQVPNLARIRYIR